MDVGEVEAGTCLVRDRVVEISAAEMSYILGVIVIVVRVIIIDVVVVLAVELVVLELVTLVRAHAVLEVVLVIGGAMVPVVIVCHELPFSSLACSAW
jgi:NAD/NADP transhydrogenase beta subunit